MSTNQHTQGLAVSLDQAPAAPDISLTQPHAQYEGLLRACRSLPPIKTAVVHPCDESSLEALRAASIGRLIDPVIVGPEGRIRELATRLHLDLTNVPLIPAPHSHAAAEQAVALARTGAVSALMKGSLHTDELMSEVIRRDGGIRTERRVSHVFVMDVPTYPKPLYITDAAVNLFPSLEEKADILQNAIDLARALGLRKPKVAILSAVETISSKMPSTLDAAALCKMADRGQITGAILDGPLALDNAINVQAASAKSIRSEVAGDADILLVPTLEAGNMLVKELTFLANADAAGIVLGAQVPIILTSRADSVRARLASCAIALLYARRTQAAPAF